jgi:prophage DNA circulation protein
MTNITDNFVAALQAADELNRSSANDPADQIRLLVGMASFTASAPPSVTTIGGYVQTVTAATAALARRSALAALANATAAYNPQSIEDAAQVLALVTPLYDAEVIYAADIGDTSTYQALRVLRAAVVSDLQTRGAMLPDATTTFGGKPAKVIAYRLYGDATRGDEILSRNPDAPFPGQMPLVVNVLSK